MREEYAIEQICILLNGQNEPEITITTEQRYLSESRESPPKVPCIPVTIQGENCEQAARTLMRQLEVAAGTPLRITSEQQCYFLIPVFPIENAITAGARSIAQDVGYYPVLEGSTVPIDRVHDIIQQYTLPRDGSLYRLIPTCGPLSIWLRELQRRCTPGTPGGFYTVQEIVFHCVYNMILDGSSAKTVSFALQFLDKPVPWEHILEYDPPKTSELETLEPEIPEPPFYYHIMTQLGSALYAATPAGQKRISKVCLLNLLDRFSLYPDEAAPFRDLCRPSPEGTTGEITAASIRNLFRFCFSRSLRDAQADRAIYIWDAAIGEGGYQWDRLRTPREQFIRSLAYFFANPELQHILLSAQCRSSRSPLLFPFASDGAAKPADKPTVHSWTDVLGWIRTNNPGSPSYPAHVMQTMTPALPLGPASR